VALPGATSGSGFGMFDLKARRLVDLGLLSSPTCARSPDGKMVWMGQWVPPHTQKGFLGSPKLQYAALVASLTGYYRGLKDGTIPRPDGGRPGDMSLSGVLAILHKCGPRGLKVWNAAQKFESTQQLYDAANGIF